MITSRQRQLLPLSLIFTYIIIIVIVHWTYYYILNNNDNKSFFDGTSSWIQSSRNGIYIMTTLYSYLMNVMMYTKRSHNSNSNTITLGNNVKQIKELDTAVVIEMNNQHHDNHHYHHRKLLSSSSSSSLEKNMNNNQKMKYIIVMGLPRSGSDAVHQYFQCHNIPSTHYCCYQNENDEQPSTGSSSFFSASRRSIKEERSIRFPCTNSSQTCGQCVYNNIMNENKLFDQCTYTDHNNNNNNNNNPIHIQVHSQFDVEIGKPLFSWFLPQHYSLPLLYESYPTNSIWILNHRANAEIWANNILHWYSVTKRILNAFHIPYYDNTTMPNNNNHNIIYKPKHDLIQLDLEKQLEISYQRSYNNMEHLRRKKALMSIYSKHIQKVKAFAKQYEIPIFDLNVDDPYVEKKLIRYFFKINNVKSIHNERSKVCWKFNGTLLDNDYKDFTTLFPRQL